jgi:hypothetical protein
MTCAGKGVVFAIGPRKSTYGLLLLAITLLTACSGGGQGSTASGPRTVSIPTAGPGDLEKLFHLTPGNRWGFNVTVNTTGQPSTNQFELAKTTGPKEMYGYTTAVLSYSGPDNAEEYYVKNNAGVFFFGDNSGDPVTAAITPYQVLRFPVLAGDSFVQVDQSGIDFGDDLDGDGVNETIAIHSIVTVVGLETVVVPSGTFDNCARLQTNITETVTLSRSGTMLSAVGVSTEWYAPRVGLVKKFSTFSGSGITQVFDRALAKYSVDGNKSDVTPPGVTAVQPGPGSVLTTQIQAAFSEDLDPLSVNPATFFLRDPAGQPVAGTVSYLNKTATFALAMPLAPGTYAATVTTGVQDVMGNPLPADYTWTFSVDRTAPTIISTAPPGNATNVSPSGPISVTFSEEMDVASLNAYSSFTVTGGGYQVFGTVTYSNKTATFIPYSGLDRNTLYTATISTAVTDLSGNHLAANYSWTFTTDPGLFKPYVNFPTGSWPEAVAIGDVNGDGRNDVVMTTSFYFDSANDYKVFVFLQNADGTLAPPVKYATASTYTCRAATVSIGDVNHDGRNDVVIGESGCGIEVFLQNGAGSLAAGVFYPSVDSYKIRIADINNDGLPDVVGIGWGTDTASVWLQNGGGTLDPPVAYGIAHGGWDDLEVGDVNKDGLADIVVMSGQASLRVGVLAQKPGGGFAAPAYYNIPDVFPGGIAVGDLNGDGASDVVVAYGGNRPSSKIGVYYQNASGTLDPIAAHDSYDSPEATEIADVTGDGRKDVVVLHGGWMAMGVYQQMPDGTLAAEDLYGIPYASHYNPHGLAVGDISGDGRNDVVIADYNYGLVVLYRNDSVAPTAFSTPRAVMNPATPGPLYFGKRLRK